MARPRPDDFIPHERKKLTAPEAYRIKNMFADLVKRHLESPLDAEEIYKEIGRIRGSKLAEYEPCKKCYRFLSARERMYPCRFCQFNNWKEYAAITYGRKRIKAAVKKHSEPGFQPRHPLDYD